MKIDYLKCKFCGSYELHAKDSGGYDCLDCGNENVIKGV